MANLWKKAGTYLDLVYTFPVIILAGAGGGYLLDRWAGSSPYGTLGGFILGLAAAFTYLIRMLNALKNRRDGGDGP